jgi:hypothetical protein
MPMYAFPHFPQRRSPERQEVARVAAPLRMLAALAHDRLRLCEREFVDERFVDAARFAGEGRSGRLVAAALRLRGASSAPRRTVADPGQPPLT